MSEPMRIQRALARAGVASRRKAEELIAAGRVTVNGDVASIGQVVDPGKDRILVDGQALGKVNFAPATAGSPNPAPLTYTVTQTTVLQKGGHVIAVQYAGAKNVIFTLKSWNLAVQAYPEALEAPESAE